MYTKRLAPMYSIIAGLFLILSITASTQNRITVDQQQVSENVQIVSSQPIQGTPAVAGIATVAAPASIPVCFPSDIKAEVNIQGNSDTREGSLNLINTSNKACDINAGSFIKVAYDTVKIKNLNVITQGNLLGGMVVLDPGKKLSSTVKYLNGSQCSTGFSEEFIRFTYIISEANQVVFQDAKGKSDVSINICGQQSDQSNITISNVFL